MFPSQILAEPSPRIEEKRSDRRKAPFRLEKADLKPRESKNFLAQNKTQMIGAKPKGKGSSDTSPEKHQEYGQVPGYLQQRKKRFLPDLSLWLGVVWFGLVASRLI